MTRHAPFRRGEEQARAKESTASCAEWRRSAKGPGGNGGHDVAEQRVDRRNGLRCEHVARGGVLKEYEERRPVCARLAIGEHCCSHVEVHRHAVAHEAGGTTER
eukprot:scaffold170281_cov29-Tisochrysis_lutea.AAC.3